MIDSAIQVLMITSSTNLVIVLAKLVAKSKCRVFMLVGATTPVTFLTATRIA